MWPSKVSDEISGEQTTADPGVNRAPPGRERLIAAVVVSLLGMSVVVWCGVLIWLATLFVGWL